jgi:hypothetical protein
MKGHVIYQCEPWDEFQGYYLLALAIIRRTLKDAKLRPERYKEMCDRKEAEAYKTDALEWLAAVRAMSPKEETCHTQ